MEEPKTRSMLNIPPQQTTTAPVYPQIIVKVSIPNHGLQKALRCSLGDSVSYLKKQLIEKTVNEIPNALNYGLFLPGGGGKAGKFLEEKRELHVYKFEQSVSLEFVQKCKVPANGASPSTGEFELTPALKKRNKAFIEDCSKQNYDRVREKCKLIDPNCWADDEGTETPLISAIMNDDREMINILIENGAHLDFRLGAKDTWKTPLHVAAAQNKPRAVQVLLAAGAWGMITDVLGLTPLYYGATIGSKDIVHRLLVSRSSPEVFDENGKGPLHQACLNNHDQIVWLLIDFGANLNVKNSLGNTPLHVSASRNSINCAKFLLLRGANRTTMNKVNQLPVQVAAMSQNTDLADLISQFQDENIIPPPPMPSFNDTGEISIVSVSVNTLSMPRNKTLTSKLRKSILLADERFDNSSKSVLSIFNKSATDLEAKSTNELSAKSNLSPATRSTAELEVARPGPELESKSVTDLDIKTSVSSKDKTPPPVIAMINFKAASPSSSLAAVDATPTTAIDKSLAINQDFTWGNEQELFKRRSDISFFKPVETSVSNSSSSSKSSADSNILRIGMEGSSYQLIDGLKFMLSRNVSGEDVSGALHDLDTLKGMLEKMNVRLMKSEGVKASLTGTTERNGRE